MLTVLAGDLARLKSAPAQSRLVPHFINNPNRSLIPVKFVFFKDFLTLFRVDGKMSPYTKDGFQITPHNKQANQEEAFLYVRGRKELGLLFDAFTDEQYSEFFNICCGKMKK